MSFKYGDIIAYNGGRFAVIEQRGDFLLVEALGDTRTAERFTKIDTRTEKINLVEKSTVKELIRHR
jgi:hypothetical protein